MSQVVFLCKKEPMALYIFSDESGVFDPIHHDFFVFGGLIFKDKCEMDNALRRYRAAEKTIRKKEKYKNMPELKASFIGNAEKRSLFNIGNPYARFGAVVNLKRLRSFSTNKKDKQRYMDFAYKLAVKHALKEMLGYKEIDQNDASGIFFYVDEHATATNGRYDLEQSMFKEFFTGMYTNSFTWIPPMLPGLTSLEVKYRDSTSSPLVRCADIIANRLLFEVKNGTLRDFKANNPNFYITFLP